MVDPSSRPRATVDDEEDDPELRAAIEASLREAQAPQPSAPVDASSESSSAQVIPSNELRPLEADAIMTFSQTIQEADARGTRDLVRYPGVGELFTRANELQPKLTTNLDETVEKERMLTEMHEKLSEAVKLYDRLLTEQVSNPARRYGQYANQYAAPSQQYSTPAPQVSQWATPSQQWHIPSSQVAPPPVQQAAYQQQQQPQYSYSQPGPPSATPTPSRQYTTSEYPVSATPTPYQMEQPSAPNHAMYAPAPGAPVPAPPHMQPQQQQQQPQSQQQQPTYAPSSPVQYYAPPPTHAHPTYATPNPAPPQRPMYASPPPGTPMGGPPPPQQAPPHAYSTMLPNFPSAPTTAPQSYGYSAPAFEQKELKEAMLISFD